MFLSLLLACATPDATPTAPVAAPAGNPKVNLGPAPDIAAAIGIDDVLANAAQYEGKTVVVKATVTTVCQKKGCWHRLGTANPDVTVMCKDKEYEIFLPFDAAGKTAVVAGVFSLETLSLADAKHFAEDAGKDPATVTEPVTQYSIELAGLTFL